MLAIFLSLVILACRKDEDGDTIKLQQVNYKIEQEDNENIEPYSTVEMYSNLLDSIVENEAEGTSASFADAVIQGDYASIRIQPVNTTKAKLTVSINGNILYEKEGSEGEELFFEKEIEKSDF